MSAAQWLIVAVGLVTSSITFALMRYPEHRREQFRGQAFSVRLSAIAALIVLAFCLLMAWAQGRYEAERTFSNTLPPNCL
jgi:ABC-type Fe3+ transport system permease subunit